MRKDGFQVILWTLFLGSLAGQIFLQLPEEGATATAASVLENWQSEFLQLIVQFAISALLADKIAQRLQRKEKQQIKEAVKEALSEMSR